MYINVLAFGCGINTYVNIKSLIHIYKIVYVFMYKYIFIYYALRYCKRNRPRPYQCGFVRTHAACTLRVRMHPFCTHCTHARQAVHARIRNTLVGCNQYGALDTSRLYGFCWPPDISADCSGISTYARKMLA